MDTICIRDIEVFAYHGVMKEENALGQKFLITASLSLSTREAGISDDLEKSVNYAEVCRIIKEYAENNTFKLIETLAEGIARLILTGYDIIEAVTVEIKKPWAPVQIPVDTVSVSIKRCWHDAYLSIGSNMGDKKRHLDLAVERLGMSDGIKVMDISDYIVTAPVGYTSQDDFLNAAVHIKTVLEPNELLLVIHDIENMDGRVRNIHWGPRTIDIDIILYDELIINTKDLTIPHPEAENREFVLKPLSQIAPKVIHPVIRQSIERIYDELCTEGICARKDYNVDSFKCIDELDISYDTRIVYFGNEGSYSQQAMERFFGKGGYISYARQKFTEVMRSVSEGEADYGVVPIENSSTGGITDIYDHMLEYNIHIVGEQIIKIEHALLAKKGVKAEDIRKIYSHSQGIRQCSSFLNAHPEIEAIAVSSTASGAKAVAEAVDNCSAAIASEKAAEIYGLCILKSRINKLDNNSTRFVVFSSEKKYIKNAKKISISFEAKHESGALYRILSHFYRNGINLEKIESRPIPDRTWEYRFFVDIAGNLMMQSVKNALGGAEEESEGLTILGNY